MNNTFKKHIKSSLPYVTATVIVVLFFLLLQKYQYHIQLFAINESRRQKVLSDFSVTLQDFMTIAFGIIIEALPFVILGVLFSVLIQTFLPTEKLIKKLPKNKLIRRTLISFLGVAMPVCECGNIPVTRSLIAKGFSAQEAIVFLLSAPSINIVTFAVTWEAFNFNHSMAIVRVLATLVVANITALLVTKLIKKDEILTKEFTAVCEGNNHTPNNLSKVAKIFKSEMWTITRLLIIGALIAAASQTFMPREVITAIADNVALSVLAMLILAFVISICSSVDAFFALAYVNIFNLGPILAFLVAGPMVDIKMIAMMKTTFTYRTLAVITGSVFILSFIVGVIFSYVW